jgi:hypothetical protein
MISTVLCTYEYAGSKSTNSNALKGVNSWSPRLISRYVGSIVRGANCKVHNGTLRYINMYSYSVLCYFLTSQYHL